MKSLTDYIKESLVKEAVVDSKKTYRFNLNKIDGGKEVENSIETLGVSKGFYTEKTDDGILVKFTPENISKAVSVVELIQTFISGIPSEKHEDIGEPLEKLVSQLDKLSADIEDTDAAKIEPEEEPKTEETPKKEEDKNKEEE